MNRERKIDIEQHLERLNDMDDYEVADDNPDVRNWKVYSSEGIKFGKVDELIVDPEFMKVRYLDIEVDDGVEGVTEEKHLLVPIGVASLDEKEDKVFIRTIQTVSLLKTPAYKGGIVTREYEDEVRRTYSDKDKDEEYYYDSEYFDENRFYGGRRKSLKDKNYLFSASSLIGEEIGDSKGNNIGKIEDIFLDVSKSKIAVAILSFSGRISADEDKYFAVPWEVIKIDAADDKFYINIPEEKLADAPTVDKSYVQIKENKEYVDNIYKYYGANPLW